MPAEAHQGPSHGRSRTPEPQRLLSVLVPAYNEERTISELLRRVVAAPYPKEVLVVDDGSTDGTASLLAEWDTHPAVRVLRHATNGGKGTAIRTALRHARGRFVVIQDADLEYDPRDYPLLVEPLLRGEADIVYGSRYLPSASHRHRWRLLRMGVSAVNLCCRLVHHVRLTDTITCYKALPTSLLRAMDLRCEGFEFCSEVTAKACRLGLKIREVPIQYHPRGYGEGKKIRCGDGFRMLWALWKWRRWRGAWSPEQAGEREASASR